MLFAGAAGFGSDDLTRFRQVFKVNLNPKILTSDEAIVAAISHEVHESSLLFDAFVENNEVLDAETVLGDVDPKRGTFHSQAWDFADEIVLRMRAAGKP